MYTSWDLSIPSTKPEREGLSGEGTEFQCFLARRLLNHIISKEKKGTGLRADLVHPDLRDLPILRGLTASRSGFDRFPLGFGHFWP